MPITAVTSDPDALTLTVIGDYPVPLERLWEAYADPRRLERFWGPVEWPATFTRHDFVEGGRSRYYMTGSDGTRAHGWWKVLRIEEGRFFEVEDGFAHEDGSPDATMPTMRMRITFEATPDGSRFTSVTFFRDLESMEELTRMGMIEGMRSALSQLDPLLEDLASFAATRATDARFLNDTQVRFTRHLRGSPEEVWRAHHDADLMCRWMLGPDGWTMPVCEVAHGAGDRFRYEWEEEGGANRFGFEGELLETSRPRRLVNTERLLGTDGPETLNEMTLTPMEGGTLLSLVITYPDKETRDAILDTGMTDGMEMSYRRLENEVLGQG